MNQPNSLMSGEAIENLIGVVEKVEPKFCRNCGQPIEPIRDPWSYTNHGGKSYGFFHSHLVDRYEGNISKAEWCVESQCAEDSHDVIAEPETDEERLKRLRGTPYFLNSEGQEEIAPGITKIDLDRFILRSE